MFGCVYFKKDKSLVVVSKNSKDLKIKDEEFAPKCEVSMDFKKDGIFHGVVVKTDDSKDYLNRYANHGYKALIQGRKEIHLSELFNFEPPDHDDTDEIAGKRIHRKSKKMVESEEQNEELSPKKKKKHEIKNIKAKIDENKNKKLINNEKDQSVSKIKASKKKLEVSTENENNKCLIQEMLTDISGQFSDDDKDSTSYRMEEDKKSDTESVENSTTTYQTDNNTTQNSRNMTVLKPKSPIQEPEECNTFGSQLIEGPIVRPPVLQPISNVYNVSQPNTQQIPFHNQHQQWNHDASTNFNFCNVPLVTSTPINKTPQSNVNDSCHFQSEWINQSNHYMPFNQTVEPSSSFTGPSTHGSKNQSIYDSALHYDESLPKLNYHQQTRPRSRTFTETMSLAMGASRTAWNVPAAISTPLPKSSNSIQSNSATYSALTPPPPDIVQLFQLLLKPDVRDYIKEFCEHFGKDQNKDVADVQSMEVSNEEDSDCPSPSLLQMECPMSSFDRNRSKLKDKDKSTCTQDESNQDLSPRRSPRIKSKISKLSENDKSTKKCTANSPECVSKSDSKSKVNDDSTRSVVTSAKRKLITTPTKTTSSESKNVKLTPNCDITVARDDLSKVVRKAKNESNPGFFLMRKLMFLLFSKDELAGSRGQGLTISKSKEGDFRQPLDKTRVQAAKEYTRAWCKMNQRSAPAEEDLNKGVTEAVGYSRKAIKKAK